MGLVRSIVRRQARISYQDFDDAVQAVFAALIPALRSYDKMYSLPRFISMVTERVCIQDYRRTTAAKRDAQTAPVNHHDSSDENCLTLRAPEYSQEQRLVREEIVKIVRVAVRSLGHECRELLKLRYFEELPYKEITKILGSSENTLTVKTRRCLEELKANYNQLARNGVKNERN